MTTTKHTNCTHPATKAARAACRKGSAQPVAAAPRSPLAEAVDYTKFDYAFDSTECPKCFGSGTPGYLSQYAGIYGGVCFRCNSGGGNTTGRILTRAGQAAKKAHDAWIAEHLTIPARDLQPGMKFRRIGTSDGWRTVVSINPEPYHAGSMTIGSGDDAVTTEMWHIDITTQKITLSMSADAPVQRTATQAERAELIAAIAGRKGTILTPKN